MRSDEEVIRHINEIIDRQIQPSVELHGGKVSLEKYEDGIATIFEPIKSHILLGSTLETISTLTLSYFIESQSMSLLYNFDLILSISTT